jgi:2-polyprenyl-3-methyl-5-hydroxy-6-metoxy-1,4-benzoquinol methylase
MKSKNNKEAVATHFNQRAETYSQLFKSDKYSSANWLFQSRLDIIDSCMTSSINSLLDCASGTGEITMAATSASKLDVLHINDLTQAMLDEAGKNLNIMGFTGDLSLSNFDVFQLDIEIKRKFDCVLCLGLLAHTGRLDELLKVIGGLVKPGGLILFQSSLLDNLGIKIIRALSQKRHMKRCGYSISYYFMNELLTAFEGAGLQLVKTVRYGLGLPFGDRISPKLSYLIEKKLKNVSSEFGSEAVFVLRKPDLSNNNKVEK